MNLDRRIDEWGRAIFKGEDAIELLFRDQDITKLAIEHTPEIQAYNELCVKLDKSTHVIPPLTVPADPPEIDSEKRQATWWMPTEYHDLDVREKLLSLCQDKTEIDRVNLEMDMFEKRGLLPVLRLMCFFVDHWRHRGVVWGVGRGSSVASYCLFLIGVHKINSIYYDLDIKEFLK